MPTPPQVQSLSKFMCKLITELRKTRKEITVHTIMNTILRLRDKWTHPKCGFVCREPFNDIDWLRDVDSIVKKILGISENKHSQWTYFKSILAVLSCLQLTELHKAYTKASAPLRYRIDDEYESGVTSERLEKSWLSWDEIIARRDAVRNTMPEVYLILCLYTMHPPVRDDYCEMDIIRKEADITDTKRNYYCIDTNVFIFNSFKTEAIKGIVRVPVVPELAKVIYDVRLVHMPASLNTIPLLVSTKNKPIRNGRMSEFMSRAFDVPMNPTMIRHIFLTQKYPDIFKDSSQMMTSPGSIMHYYVKHN